MINTLCIISARNLGDAVIHADFIKKIAKHDFAKNYLIWTFPGAEFLFSSIPGCVVFVSDFPMGHSKKSFIFGGFIKFIRTLIRVRRFVPDATIDLIGDIREILIARLIRAEKNYYPKWPFGHPFLKYIRLNIGYSKLKINIPSHMINIYEAYEYIIESIAGNNNNILDLRVSSQAKTINNIGIHPFASKEFKSWPIESWILLIKEIKSHSHNIKITLFGHPSERKVLEDIVSKEKINAEIFTKTLPEFNHKMKEMDLLIGLDSFSVHLAHSLNVESITIFGSNHYNLFTPPTSIPVYKSGYCNFQPCNGKPKCINKSFQYKCMSSISIIDVFSKIRF
jgi:heptosyltransferase-3